MNQLVLAPLFLLTLTASIPVAVGSVAVGYNSGTIIINNTTTGAQTTCAAFENNITEETVRRVAEAAAQNAAQSGADWKGTVDAALAALHKASAANATRLNAISAGQVKITNALASIQAQLVEAKADNAATHEALAQEAQKMRDQLTTTETELLGALEQLRQADDAKQQATATRLEHLEQSIGVLLIAIGDSFKEYLPSNPALRVATQVSIRAPGPLAILAGQASYATQLSNKWMLGLAIGAGLGLPINDGKEGGYQGPSGNVIESLKYKEHVVVVEVGPEVRHGLSKNVRFSLQGLYRHSFITWHSNDDEPELSYGAEGVLGRGAVDVLLWGPIFVGAAAACGTEFSSRMPSRKYTGVLGNVANPVEGGRRPFVEGGIGLGLAVFP